MEGESDGITLGLSEMEGDSEGMLLGLEEGCCWGSERARERSEREGSVISVHNRANTVVYGKS
jgi:hypothetical protein